MASSALIITVMCAMNAYANSFIVYPPQGVVMYGDVHIATHYHVGSE